MRPYLRVANVYEDRIDLSDVMQMHFEPKEVDRFELVAGDILLNEGQSRELVGRPAMYRGELPGACFTNSLVRFKAAAHVDNRFALQLFRHWLKSGTFQSIAQITTNIAHLGAGRFAEMDFPLPPLAEQHRIVAKLESLQARSRRAREALDAVPPLLEKLRQSILAAAFRGDLTKDWRAKNKDVEPATELLKRIRIERRKKWEESELAKMKAKGKAPMDDRWKAKYREPEPVDTEGLPELPQAWCWASLDTVLAEELSNGRSVPTDHAGFPVLRLTCLKHGLIDLKERKGGAWTAADAASSLVRKDDFLVSRGNGSLGLVGRGGLVMEEPDPVAFPDTLIRVRVAESVDRSYLAHVWSSRVVRSQIERAAKTTAGIFKVSQGDLEMIVLPVPSVGEQQRIAVLIDAALAGVRSLELALKALLTNSSSVDRAALAKAFCGELLCANAHVAWSHATRSGPPRTARDAASSQRRPS